MDSCAVSKIIFMKTLFYLSTFNLSVLVLYWIRKSTKNALSRRDNTQIAKYDEKTQRWLHKIFDKFSIYGSLKFA